MTVTVTMSAEEFAEFLEFQKDKKVNVKRINRLEGNVQMMKKEILWAIAPDGKKPGKYIISDHDHADDLWVMANDSE